jgi:Tat protein translocase TatC
MGLLPDDPIDERRLTLGQHLEELRWHVLRAIIYIAVALTVCMFIQEPLMQIAIGPHLRAVSELTAEARGQVPSNVPKATAQAARDWLEARDRIKKGLREADRQSAVVREELEADPAARAEQLSRDEATLEKDIAALQDDLKALASKPDEARARELDARRAELDARAAALDQRGARLTALADESARGPRSELIQPRYTESFMSYLWVSFIAAIFLASPFVARELWSFVSKGLYPHEKRYVTIFAPLTYAAFIIGALFGYYLMLPTGLKYLASYGSKDIYAQFDLGEYLSLFIGFTLAVGLMFELPPVMAFLSLIGLFKPETYAGFRRYWILVAFIVAMILAPAPDPLSQCMCAVPLIGLFELGIWLSRLVRRKHDEMPPEPPAPTPIAAAPIAAAPAPLALPAPPPAPTPAPAPAPGAAPVPTGPTSEVKS